MYVYVRVIFCVSIPLELLIHFADDLYTIPETSCKIAL